MEFNKLVRDKIPSIIEKNGETPVYYRASKSEYYQRLKTKLQEEVDEFLQSNDLIEIADILEVIDSILLHKKVSQKEILQIKSDKKQSKGGFQDRIILERVN